jgi:pimeloyl-ACP methyl ester carboxylesterase
MYDCDYDSAAGDRQLAAIYAAPNRRPALAAITFPTATLRGGDNLVDPAASQELHEIITESTLTVYRSMGHSLPCDRRPDIVTEIRAVASRYR